ncbi:MAG: hypothetical protein Q8O42_18015 [Acidobacteriota bacterium]|nr:hypothetical protein [Acidobacteriota bacterium]
MRAHALLSLLFLLSRTALDLGGLPFAFSLDWMWLADPADLRSRWLETLYFFHAFPPGMNLATGLLLKAGGEQAAVLAHWAFSALGLVLVNALFVVARGVGLSTIGAWLLAAAFALTPASLYFEHLYHYEWPVTTLLCVAAALFAHGVRSQSFGVWLACFAVCALVGATRSTFHLAWFVMVAGLGVWACDRGAHRRVLAAVAIPGLMLVALYAKNAVLFGAFAISTFGPASYTLLTVARLPLEVRDAWIAQGRLSPFAAVSVYAPPREYARFFETSDHAGWPPQMTRLEHTAVTAPNFNHWWLLEVHRARLADVRYHLWTRPADYAAAVLAGLEDLFGPTTAWHPSDHAAGVTTSKSRSEAGGSPHDGHRRVLGRYEAWFNRLVHGFPIAPVGLYLFLPVPLVWAAARARSQLRDPNREERVRGALLLLLLLQIAFVGLASTMLTALEAARYRFQIEWMIWVVVTLFATQLVNRTRPGTAGHIHDAPLDLQLARRRD